MQIRKVLKLLAVCLVLCSFGIASDEVVQVNFFSNSKTGPAVSFEEFSKMATKKERVAAFKGESSKNKSILWAEHIAYYRGVFELSLEQRRFLDKLSQLLDEEFFSRAAGVSEAEFIESEQGKPFGNLMKQAPELFTTEQRKQLFLVVGDISAITDFGCGNVLISNSGSRAFRSCDCTASICGTGCENPVSCPMTLPGLICLSTPDGCGCFGYFGCSGLCGYQ